MIKLITLLRPVAKYILGGWVITMIVLSSTPNLPTLKLHTAGSEIRLDYLIHFCEYGFLGFMAYLSFMKKNFRIDIKKFIFISLCLIVFALADEFHQRFIPGRTFNVKDILSNLLGIVSAIVFCVVVFSMMRRRSEA